MVQYFFQMIIVSFEALQGADSNIKMPSYQYRKSHCGDEMTLRRSYLHNGISLRCCRPEVTIPSDRLAGGDRNSGLHRFLDKG